MNIKLYSIFVALATISTATLSSCVQTTKSESSAQSDSLATRPNILFCIADDASMQHMSAYGKGHTDWVKSPNFDKVAKQGILFTNAYTPNSKCSPSRSTILTGRNPWQLEEAVNHSPSFPEKFTTFMEAMLQNGYFTGFTGKGWSPGIPGVKNGKERQLTGKAYNTHTLIAPTKQISNKDYAENFANFLEAKPSNQPFCFWFGAHEPHRSYKYKSGADIGKKKASAIKSVPAYWPDNEQVRNDMLDYALEVEYFDQQLGKILDALEKSGQLENTIIVVTSDNGMPFPRTKGHVYEYSNHLPLAIMWKNGLNSPGRKVDDFVSFIDFAPTFIEAANIPLNKAGMQPMTGRSLLNIIRSDKNGQVEPTRDHVLLGRERNDVGRPNDQGYPVRGIIKDGLIFTINYKPERWPVGNPETGYLDTDGGPTKTSILEMNRIGQSKWWDLSFGKRAEEELYDYKNDIFSIHNLATNPSYSDKKKSLKNQLEKELKQQNDLRVQGKGDIYDAYQYSSPAVRGFYERFKKGEKMKTDWAEPTDFEKDSTVYNRNKK